MASHYSLCLTSRSFFFYPYNLEYSDLETQVTKGGLLFLIRQSDNLVKLETETYFLAIFGSSPPHFFWINSSLSEPQTVFYK